MNECRFTTSFIELKICFICSNLRLEAGGYGYEKNTGLGLGRFPAFILAGWATLD